LDDESREMMQRLGSRLIGMALIASGLWAGAALAAPTVAFPGAQGYGRFSQGGSGGAIIAVTTLADAGPGSLRACIDAKGPRVCVFRVGGIIRFTTRRPMITNPYVTIAGQTAPGGGILLTHAGGADAFTPLVVKNTHDVVIRDIRVRPDRPAADRGANGSFTIENSRNVILDHVSGAWAVDQILSGYGDNTDITVSGSIFAEGIQPHDKCALMASDPKGPQRFSFIGNLCAHSGDRNPDANFPPGSCVEINNNVLYNAASQFAEIWESYGGTPVNIINNSFIRGPNTAARAVAIDLPRVGSTGRAQIYEAGNSFDGSRARLLAPTAAAALVSRPFCGAAAPVLSAAQSEVKVLATAGAWPRDAFDTRIINEVRSRSGRIRRGFGQLDAIAAGQPYPDTDRDGMDDDWERSHRLDPTRNDAWGDIDNDGWRNLDAFLADAHARLMSPRPPL
jgi:pectate lyase